MAHDNNTERELIPLNIAILTVSDSRTEATDKAQSYQYQEEDVWVKQPDSSKPSAR